MDKITKEDLHVVMHSMLQDAIKEALAGNEHTARLLQAYAVDIYEILDTGGDSIAQD